MNLAFDKSSRRIDADGRMHVERSHISKAIVNPYYGREIPGYESLGLDPETVYQLLRDPKELESAAPTFARLPILSEHVPVTVDAPRQDLVVGAIGSDVEFNAPYLDADLCVWDAKAIAGVESKQIRELSCAYRYVPVMEAGTFEGKPYDGRMTQIQGNHLALVEAGRAGADVVVADQNPFKSRNTAMKMSKLGRALFAAIGLASPKLAADSALPAMVGTATRKGFDKAGTKAKLIALDADLDPQQLDNVIDALLDVEQEPKPTETPAAAADESPADKIRALLAGKVADSVIDEITALCSAPAEDEGAPHSAPNALGLKKTALDDEVKKEDVKAAMDSLRAEFRDATAARADVRSVVGDVLGMDSAAEIYGFALDHLKVDRKDVAGVPALRALFKVAANGSRSTPPAVAQDSAGLAAKFPGVSRFGRL